MTILYASGSESEQVRDLQRKLATLTHGARSKPIYAGACDGIYGKVTADAVKLFQEQQAIAPANGICNGATWTAINDKAGSVFAETWQYEFDVLQDKPNPSVAPVREGLAKEVHEAALAGLAFSGGGIRSATFNLGVLQALAQLKMLRDFHYLSTVSGGGYIGSWFSKWLHELGGDIGTIEARLTPGTADRPVAREPDEIRFLRQHSNYLTPKTGLLSADTWAVLTTYLRNMLLNLTILVALLAACMVLPRLLSLFVSDYISAPLTIKGMRIQFRDWSGFAMVAIAAVLWSVSCIALSISAKPDRKKTKRIRGQSQGSVILYIVLPLMLAAFTGSCALWDARHAIATQWDALFPLNEGDPAILAWLFLPGVAYFFAWIVGWSRAQGYNRRPTGQAPAPRNDWLAIAGEGLGHLLCAVAAFAAGSLMLIMLMAELDKRYPVASATANATSAATTTINVIAFGMPTLLIVFGLTMVLSVGLVGRMYREQSREWWSRQGAWTCILVVAWLALVAVTLYAPAIVAYIGVKFGPWVSAALGSAWLGTTLSGLALGSSSATGKRGSRPYLEFLAGLAPFVFSIGALLLVSALVHHVTRSAAPAVALTHTDKWSAFFQEYNTQTLAADSARLGWAYAIFMFIGLVLAWRVDINRFSLHMMYRNRLARAYLGASNAKRSAHPFSGFDENDDLHMEELAPSGGVAQRPIHIVNTALNLVNGAELAWQTRKAAAFSFTPMFTGFELPSMGAIGASAIESEAQRGIFRRTAGYRAKKESRREEETGIKLGMTMAVSGAAASPSMGYHSSPALSFLMTLFNVRLGRWFANPRRKAPDGGSSSPRAGLYYLISELFGWTNADSNYVYLSDGGHFENLGVYELVRRRCRLIVVVDAGADGGLTFEDLGNAIRKCATDLRVEIDIDVRQIEIKHEAQFSESYCVHGNIHYDKVDQDGEVGTLLYIKPALLGTEGADVLNYRKTNLAFPHQSTADQWFDEPQFESYRALGYHIGLAALQGAAAKALKDDGNGHHIVKLCAQLKNAWAHPDQPRNNVHTIRGPGDRRHVDRRQQ